MALNNSALSVPLNNPEKSSPDIIVKTEGLTITLRLPACHAKGRQAPFDQREEL